MKITFVSQASVIIETEDCLIWTDPWLFGTAFNDSWKLFPEPNWNNSQFDKINYIWISHEHPDHFHFPTLKSLPKNFKENVTILFQKNNSTKMPDAFKKLGFKKIKLFPNQKVKELTSKTKIQITQIGQMDSSLAVIDKDKVVLNLNDCEISNKDAKNYIKKLGKIDVVLNQFSMAGYNGLINYETNLVEKAKKKLATMTENHISLNADITIPIASFIYFCMNDNKFINDYANTPEDVYDYFIKNDLRCEVLSINETLNLNKLNAHSSKKSLNKLMSFYNNKSELNYYDSEKIGTDEIKKAFIERHIQMKSKFANIFLKKMKPIKFYIKDIDSYIKASLGNGVFKNYNPINKNDYDIEINSQPLFFAFKFTWGLQTLGVSGRYFIKNKFNIWKWYRILTSLNNAEIYLMPKYFFTINNLRYFSSRFSGGIEQLKHKLIIRR
ncbi:MAG: MBL fold metallo-hydrolase [Polaribacter sp.]